MPRERTCDIDGFAIAMADILSEYQAEVGEACTKSVRKSLREGKKSVKSGAASSITQHNGKYVSGWTYTMDTGDDDIAGEIGNKKVPGLPHLLEHGHVRTGGGRVEGRPHIKDARNVAAEVLRKEIVNSIGGI